MAEAPLEVRRLQSSALVAVSAHGKQRRMWTGEPFVIHPLRVGDALLRKTGDIELAMAGNLHDTVEDTDLSILEIRTSFGERVADLVGSVTKSKKLSKSDREKEFLERFKVADPATVALKLQDRLDNLIDVEDAPRGFREKYRENTERLIGAVPELCGSVPMVRNLISVIRAELTQK